MGNILTFPDRCYTADHQEFLKDGADTLQFDSSNEQNHDQKYTFPVSENFIPLQSGSLKAKDWTNQERGHFYRVKRLLELAGVPNSVDRGLTDEGDPWFVFCDFAGEVFIHLCRIDGVYLLDSPSIETPLRGPDFNHLVDAFLQRKLRRESKKPVAGNHKIVRLQRNVFLHPSTMLAALVWSLLLESDDLVMVMPQEREADNSSGVSDDQDIIFGIQSVGMAPLDLIEDNGRGATDDMPLQDILIASDSKLGQHSYMIGLSVIAASLGIMSERHASYINDVTLENILALLENTGQAEDPSSNMASQFSSSMHKTLDFLNSYEQVSADPMITSVEGKEEPVDSGVEDHTSDKLLAEVHTILQVIETEVIALTNNWIQLEDDLPGKEIGQTMPVYHSQPSQPSPVGPDTDQISSVLYKLDSIDIGESFNVMPIHAYTIDNSTLIYATFDISTADFEKTNSLLNSSSAKTYEPKVTLLNTNFDVVSVDDQAQQNTTEAREFISYLLDKGGKLEIIALHGELIFVDLDVFDVGSIDTYVMSWELDDGETISVIGLQSDYADFALIA